MSYILSLETATKTCSVALHRNQQLLAMQDFHLDKSHSSILHPLLSDMLSYCEVDKAQLHAVALSMGPGSYTGLRIGTSAAKGLCYALDIPLIAINTLEAMAYGLQPYNFHKAILCPMLDARRMEVYYQLRDASGQQIQETTPLVLEKDSFDRYLQSQEIWFFGDGSDKYQPLLQGVENARFIAGIQPSAANIGMLAQKKLEQQLFEDVAYFEPFYLKEFRTTKPKKK
ncbi:tRNA (adenosine(37)-N6)-threonylcarbamoyltransferase complex dimerization subunit type 1 TsaB [Porifericola rhodea]|uniref:tRNA (adenosine(37)-N6)-threonylcarbamoyltransferase complex dimerization subunit type 1 TsaB n=1 Tax=Porifericola rhodea TaxID=930972 RepID=UPI002666413D|nr:tRNA (adenosine(37)-N6)-threonylcarbamoyltransferase complex dimerization subunit type 1 TsaB [Porifericola rhodea]WKN31772.1 tRNA (adenosine(37)-N6)-threonylcarbamoyltransferase complex dimerization subunit type 1 TsaB [Porifericola rhodea]